MVKMQRNHDAVFRAGVAMEAIKVEKILAQLAGECGLHTSQIF
jgi:hypothetical protein